MAQEIDLGGTIYISSKYAAEKTGYTQDYIGQLARGGAIEAKRVSGMWYILEDSLHAYKEKADQFVPTPPEGFTKSDSEVAVSFDGKDYISANRAAKLTGYNQDYVGQLARSGQVLSRQVANRWYIDRESLLAHKAEKDALLAAVQVESVGLSKNRPEPIVEEEAPLVREEEAETHFSYVQEETPIIPATPVFESYSPPQEPEQAEISSVQEIAQPEFVETQQDPAEEEIQEIPHEEVAIPIRVMTPDVVEEVYIAEDLPRTTHKKASKINMIALSSLTVVAALGTMAYMGSSLGFLDFGSFISRPETAQNAAVANSVVENSSNKAQNFAQSLFSKELVYKRE